MAKHEIVVNRLTSNDLSNIQVGVIESYEQELHYSDFAADDHINKRALDEVTGGISVAPYVDFITTSPTVSIPKQVGIPARFANMELGVKFELTLPQNGSFYPATTNGATMWYEAQYDIADRSNVARIDIYGAPDDNGKFLDAFKFTIYAL